MTKRKPSKPAPRKRFRNPTTGQTFELPGDGSAILIDADMAASARPTAECVAKHAELCPEHLTRDCGCLVPTHDLIKSRIGTLERIVTYGPPGTPTHCEWLVPEPPSFMSPREPEPLPIKPDYMTNIMSAPGMRFLLAGWLVFAVLEVLGITHAMIGQPFDMPHNCNQWDDWIHWCR